MRGDTPIRIVDECSITWDWAITQAAKIGRYMCRDFPGVEASDIESEVLTKTAEQVTKYPGRWEVASEALRIHMMQQFGREYGTKELRDTRYFNPAWSYSPKEVRALLECVYVEDMWLVPVQKDREQVVLEESGLTVPLMDIKAAIEKLPPSEKSHIERRYRDGDTTVNSTGDKGKTLSRAVDSITDSLNQQREMRSRSPHEGTGSRRAMTNENARSLTE